jgi:hypothetical protein
LGGALESATGEKQSKQICEEWKTPRFSVSSKNEVGKFVLLTKCAAVVAEQ